METLFDTPLKRTLGWVAVGCLLLVWSAQQLFYPTAPPPALRSQADIARLSTLPEARFADWLTDYLRGFPDDGIPRQTLLLQCVPNHPALVIAAPLGTSDEEEATHWPAPWPAVNAALAVYPAETVQTSGTHAGFHYHHLLIPVDQERQLVLLTQTMSPQPDVWSRGLTYLVLAICLTGLLLLPR